MQNPNDIIEPFKNLLDTANRCGEGLTNQDFFDGYRMAMRHALELAEVMQSRIDKRLVAE
jgi:hypothetical protein